MFQLLPGYNETPMTELTMQLPMVTHGSPFAPDFNDDGVNDLWHHNHWKFLWKEKTRWADPTTRDSLGYYHRRCFSTWDVALRNNTDGTYYLPNGGKGFIQRTDVIIEKCFDAHSTAFLDFDGDGILDMFLVTGASWGVGNDPFLDHALFWGELDEESELGYRLVGGTDSALAAGLHGRDSEGNQRGRHQYWYDANGDGLLDVITLNVERVDDGVAPGRLYLNKNGRTFQEKGIDGLNFAEFAKVAILTDLNGDGFADELVVPSGCESREGESFDRPPRNYVCDRSPRNSIATYRYDPNSTRLLRISVTAPSQTVYRTGSALTIATGDYDFDGFADVAILWGKNIDFFESSIRHARCKAIQEPSEANVCMRSVGSPTYTLDLKPLCGWLGAAGVRFADFNLDGRLDMLVICVRPGRHGIYELLSNHNWRLLEDYEGNTMSYGDLNSLTNMLGPRGICDGVPTTTDPEKMLLSCRSHAPVEVCQSLRYETLATVCSTRIQGTNRLWAWPPTVTDIDNDGYADIILAYTYGATVIVRNTLGDSYPNKFLAVRLHKTAGAARSIGAIVHLVASKMIPQSNELHMQTRILSSLSHEGDVGGGHEDRIVFGLGSTGEPWGLIVKWPHCCEVTFLGERSLLQHLSKMDDPCDVPPPPKNCDRSCMKN